MLNNSLRQIKIEKLAARQWGHVTRKQLLEIGIPSQTIANWMRRGILVRVHAGVYALGHAESTGWAVGAAAVLAGGADAALTHASCLALWEIRPWPRIPEISSPRSCRRPGIRHHRVVILEAIDRRRHLNIPTTTVARAIHDVQPRLTDRQLVRLINDARLSNRLSGSQLRRLLETTPRVRALIDPDQRPTRSGFEDDFIAFCRHHGLPRPITNTRVAGVEVDALFPLEKVIVEIDSWRYHSSRRSFQSDRERDLRTSAAGHLTARIADGGLGGAAGLRTAGSLHEILARRRAG